MERDHMSGLAVAIVNGDEMVWSKGFGFADIENRKKITPKTIFGTASITKSFTAAAIFQLQERGKLDINDPVDKYLPFKVVSSWQPEAEFTIRQVLTHTSGISNGPSLWRIIGCGDSPITLEEWAKGYFIHTGKYWHSEGNFERWPPKEGFQYSNAGYGMLAYIVERISGEKFYDYIRHNLLEPLEMHTASLRIAELDSSLLTCMYEWGDLWGFEYELIPTGTDTTNLAEKKRYIKICAYNDPVYGAGSLYCCAEELCNFLIMIRNNGIFKGKQILKKESIDTMFSAQVIHDHLPPWFVDLGMGAYAMKLDNGESVWGHTGANPGMSSIMFFNHEADLGVVVLANIFFDIRDLISWTFAEGFKAFGDYTLVDKNPNWSLYCGKMADKELKERKVTVKVITNDMHEDDIVYINGNHHKLGGWISKGIALEEQNDNLWVQGFTFFDSTELRFGVTRGSWETQEVLANGQDPEPYKFKVSKDTTIFTKIANWKDRFNKQNADK
jgi:CubicO group peptidase (beta-lactamase class C family)